VNVTTQFLTRPSGSGGWTAVNSAVYTDTVESTGSVDRCLSLEV